MTLGGWAQLALGLVQLLNWVMDQVDKSDIRDKAFLEMFAKYQELLNQRVLSMRRIKEGNLSKTEEQLDKELME